MKFSELLRSYKEGKKRVLINGMGTGDTQGLIIEVNDDYITYQLLNIKTETKSKKVKEVREIKYIPISNIFDLSEGEVEKESKPAVQAPIP